MISLKRVKGVMVLLSVVTIASVFCACGASDTKKESVEIPEAPQVTGEFACSVLKVGQADAIILQTQNHCVVIDCGEEDDGEEIVEYLADENLTTIDYLFITHFDKDHVGGVPQVLDNFEIGQVISPDYEGENAEYQNYTEAIGEKGIAPVKLTENMTFTLDDVLFEVYAPQRASYKNGDNDFSLAIGVTHGDNEFLFAGDAEAVRLQEIISQTGREYDFLKFPHHGRYNTNTKKFVESIKPAYSVITCSEKNPAEDKVLDILESAGCAVYCTKDGDVAVISNGKEITIQQ